jgi:hypothetical protein
VPPIVRELEAEAATIAVAIAVAVAEHDLASTPKRGKTMPWKAFLKARFA